VNDVSSDVLSDGLSVFPYPGLRPFRRDEADIFFGREAQVDQLLSKLQQRRFLAVVGTSGSGKSSLVRAGMIAALEGGLMAGAGPRWVAVEMRPGSRPLTHLAHTLLACPQLGQHWAAHPDAKAFLLAMLRRGPLGLVEVLRESRWPKQTNLLLLVDQFEEIFRFHALGDRNEAVAFVDILLASARQQEVPVYVVVTMRSDFLGDCSVFHGLPEEINDGQFLVPRLTREQCRAAIVGPAAAFGGQVEQPLVNRLLNDMGTDPDQLPLMQHVLMRVWTGASCREATDQALPASATASLAPDEQTLLLTADAYEATGGLKEALSNHADEAYEELTPEDQRVAEVLSRCLSERGPDQRDTRRPASLKAVADVAEVSPESVARVVEVFRRPDRSFLTPPAGVPLEPTTVLDVGHESLIRQWKRMTRWVDDESESTAIFRRLCETAKLWQAGKAAVWGTPDLENALAWRSRTHPTEAWAERCGGDLELSMQFLDASVKVRDQARRAREQQRQHELELLRQIAEAERQRADEADTRRQEHASAHRRLRLLAVVATAAGIIAAALALITWGQKNRAESARQVAVTARQNAEQLRIENEQARQAAQSTLADMQTAYGLRAAEDGEPSEGIVWFANAAALVPDDPDRRSANTMRFAAWARELSWPVRAFRLDGEPARLDFHPTQDYLLAIESSGEFSVWDWWQESTLPWARGDQKAAAMCWSPDGQWLTLGFPSGLVQLRSVPAGEVVGQVKVADAVSALAFSPDAAKLAIAGTSVRLWDCRQQRLLDVKWEHPGEVHSLIFDPGGKLLATACTNGDVYVFELGDPMPREAKFGPVPHHPQVQRTPPVFVNDGSTLVTIKSHTELLYYDSKNGRLTGSSPTRQQNAGQLLASPDGHWHLLTGFPAATLMRSTNSFRATVTGQPISSLPDLPEVRRSRILPQGHWVYAAAFNFDVSRVYTCGYNRTVKVWRTADGGLLATIPHLQRIDGMDIGPTGRYLATAQGDGLVRVWRVPMQSEVLLRESVERPTGSAIDSAEFTPDGRYFVPGRDNHYFSAYWPKVSKIAVYETTTGALAGSILELGERAELGGTDLAPDNRTAAAVVYRSSGMGSRLYVWDFRTGKPRFAPLALPARSVDVEFSHDGERLAVLSEHSILVLSSKNGDRILEIAYRARWYGSRIEFTHDDACLVALGSDEQIHILNSETGVSHCEPIRAGGILHDFTLSRDGRYLATATIGGTPEARIWDLENSGQPLCKPLPHPNDLYRARLSPDGKWLLTGAVDGQVRLWNWRSGELVAAPFAPSLELRNIDFLGEQNRWAVVSDVRGFQICDVTSGKPLTRRFEGCANMSVQPAGWHVVTHRHPQGGVLLFDFTHLNKTVDHSPEQLRLLAELISGQRHYDGGLVRLTSDEWEEAWTTVRNVIPDFETATASERAKHHLTAARELLALGDKKAIIYLERAREIDPSAEPFDAFGSTDRFRLTQILARQGRLAAAREALDKALSSVSEDQGFVRDLPVAVDAATAVLGDAPEDTELLVQRAEWLGELGRWDEAIADYSRAIHLQPELSSVYALRGHLTIRVENTSASDGYYQLVLSLAHHELSHTEEARQWYDRALKWLKRNEARSTLGILARSAMTEVGGLSRGEAETLLADLRQMSRLSEALKLDPNDPEPSVIIPAGSTWKWLHPTDGVDPATDDKDFHATFFKSDYDDLQWQLGQDTIGPAGGFGYGRPVGVPFSPPESPHRKTAYFRHRFRTDKAYENLALALQRDDGVIVYLDSVEVLRNNVAAGQQEAYGLCAEETISGVGETNVNVFRLAGGLEPGEHVLAISLHNRDYGSSDLRIAEIALWGTPRKE
jgi:WD40 repeat protein/tetratricopeptide (TPR) repeat protein/energy-coupling factor transporter ATP-binding protein EcfA2